MVICKTARHVVAVADGIAHDSYDSTRDGWTLRPSAKAFLELSGSGERRWERSVGASEETAHRDA